MTGRCPHCRRVVWLFRLASRRLVCANHGHPAICRGSYTPASA